MRIPDARLRALNSRIPQTSADYVLYWMVGQRRLTGNFALDRAVACCRELDLPLLVFEPLRVDYRWASDRFHAFVVDGMREHAEKLTRLEISYFPYLEPAPNAASGLLAELAKRAAVVVTDDTPGFFLPRMVDAAAKNLEVRMEAVDSNGLLPMRIADKTYKRAVDFRRFLQRELAKHLSVFPQTDPLGSGADLGGAKLPPTVQERWPVADLQAPMERLLSEIPIDHSVRPCANSRAANSGGTSRGRELLHRFIEHRLTRYAAPPRDLDREGGAKISPYLHFGHLGAHEVFAAIARAEKWQPDRLAGPLRGKRSGWWGVGEGAEAFLDQLVTWRELGFNMASRKSDYDRYESLPEWAQQTLADHADDQRPHPYDLDAFESASTHDELWNAAQRQLAAEGRIHNYLRMLWGKKILHWSRSPQEAAEIMIHLNNKYALDGRDPNSYSGIFWVLGRYDRAWGPERPVFGKVRYMSSANTRRKFRVNEYVRRWAGPARL